ncbi:MAG: DUF4440 domain-containing protein, partial [Cytophagales bacterium]|nr:DUF4440 domain-containing protein [Cytophagales bacterium]
MAVSLIFLLFILSIEGKVDDETIIRNKLFDQAKCWNNGDIDCFMRDYWKSDSLMYIGKKGITYGWHKTLSNYKSRYPTK